MNNENQTRENLLVVWSSADKEVALSMVFMYVRNSKKKDWWERVKLIIWGPAAKLLAVDEELQGHIEIMKDFGVEICACVTCANMYGVAPVLESLGIEVIPMGEPLTDMLKEGWASLTF
ncbi:DsrE family protein [Alkalibacter mobilis]|uniref:DsrE family protein n=1 Tax=Alkalibacter mobilis TaxID=2787712 RepID=UPI00189F6C43|nr:DsrE family protein [Alkalibacter mobilis]MBF7096281.1 DsrE family protein [Alkalibacter mobilis]